MKPLDNNNHFKSISVNRFWFKTCSFVFTSVSVFDRTDLFSSENQSMMVENLEKCLESEDETISSSSLVMYSIYLFTMNSSGKFKNEELEFKLKELGKRFKGFASPEADAKEKLSVMKIMNHCFHALLNDENFFIDGNNDYYYYYYYKNSFSISIDYNFFFCRDESLDDSDNFARRRRCRREKSGNDVRVQISKSFNGYMR